MNAAAERGAQVIRPKFERKRPEVVCSPRRFCETEPELSYWCYRCGSPWRLASEILSDVEERQWCKCASGYFVYVLDRLEGLLQSWHPEWERAEVETQAWLLMNEGDFYAGRRYIAEWELIQEGLACPVNPPLFVGPLPA